MSPGPRQLVLPLAHRPAMRRADFLASESNRAAFDFATGARAAPRRLALSGPEAAGKTHLASIWGARNGAVLLAAARLDEAQVGALADAPAAVIEDADHIAGLGGEGQRTAEALLFHALNVAAAHDIAMMITGRTAPARWPVETPDLASRLRALPHVAIAPPDDELLSKILYKLFSDRQLSVSPDATKFLVLRMERTFAAAERVVSHLDRMALAGRRAITRNLAMELYETDAALITGAGVA